MEYDEAHIIQDVLEGKTSRYEYFLDKYGQQVFTLIVRIVASQEDAEELTQDTFLKAFRHLSSFKAESNFSTWIYRIAYNTAISAVRKKKYDLFDMDDTLLANISDEQIDDTLNDESEVQIAKLNKAMKKLDADERAVITLFYMEDKPVSEIALILGMTESNTKVKLHRIRKKLYVLITMNEGLKDKGLKRAIKEQPQFRLSTNFTFRTMQKVEEAARLHEKKIEQRTLWATIIASLLLLASGIAGVIYYLGDSLTEFIQAMLPSVTHDIQIPFFYFLFAITIFLFLLFDRWMRKQYFKRHSS